MKRKEAINQTFNAFSLVELSIVILIIGILTAAIVKGNDLYANIALKGAQSVTVSSPVSAIKDLEVWHETALDESFIKSEIEDSSNISFWKNINSQKITLQKIDATQNDDRFKPKYESKSFGMLPSIRFDGVDDYLDFDANFVINSDYTVFIVGKRRSQLSDSFYFGGSDGIARSNFSLRHSPAVIVYSHYGDDLNYNVKSSEDALLPTIYTMRFSKIDGKSFWLNGGNDPDKAEPSQTLPLISNRKPLFAKFIYGANTGYGDVNIAEFIGYSRALSDSERVRIEQYLSKKYNIKISN